MKNRDLKKIIDQIPDDADVVFTNGEYKDSTTPVEQVTYFKDRRWGIASNTMVIGYKIE